MIAGILNMIQVTIENDERFIHEAKLINGGAATLNQVSRKIESGQALQEFELGSIQVAVNTVDSILTRLDVTRMHLAQLTVRRLLRAQESEQIRSFH